jgi:hypothetical protein
MNDRYTIQANLLGFTSSLLKVSVYLEPIRSPPLVCHIPIVMHPKEPSRPLRLAPGSGYNLPVSDFTAAPPRMYVPDLDALVQHSLTELVRYWSDLLCEHSLHQVAISFILARQLDRYLFEPLALHQPFERPPNPAAPVFSDLEHVHRNVDPFQPKLDHLDSSNLTQEQLGEIHEVAYFECAIGAVYLPAVAGESSACLGRVFGV